MGKKLTDNQKKQNLKEILKLSKNIIEKIRSEELPLLEVLNSSAEKKHFIDKNLEIIENYRK